MSIQRANSVTPTQSTPTPVPAGGVNFTKFICNDIFENGSKSMRSAKSPSETKIMRSSGRNQSNKSMKSMNLKESTKNIEDLSNSSQMISNGGASQQRNSSRARIRILTQSDNEIEFLQLTKRSHSSQSHNQQAAPLSMRTPTPIRSSGENKLPQNNIDTSLAELKQKFTVTPSQQQQKKTYAKDQQGVNNKVIEMWLNEMINEAENERGIGRNNSQQSDEIDKLLKYGLDRKSLLGRGISKENVDRVFRSLFVYSLGFYETLSDVFHNAYDSGQLLANVWKVYSMLLEYCSRSDFEGIVSKLEKEKRFLVKDLETKLQAKEVYFSDLEYNQKQKRDYLEQEMAILRGEKSNLESNLEQVEENLSSTEKQLKHEINLRLQFEHKINELHTIHRELLLKHNRLITEYDTLRKTKLELDDEINSLRNVLVSQKVANIEKIDEIERVSNLNREVNGASENLKHRAFQAEKELEMKSQTIHQAQIQLQVSTKWTHDRWEVLKENEDLKFRQKNQMDELEGFVMKLEERQKSLDSVSKEKSQAFETISQLNEKLEKQLTYRHDQEAKIISLKRRTEYLAIRIEDLEREIKSLNEKLTLNTNEKNQVSRSLQIEVNKNEVLMYDIAALQKVIGENKVSRAEIEGKCLTISTQLDNSQEQLKQKTAQCKELEMKISNFEHHQLKTQMQSQIAQTQAKVDGEAAKSKITRLETETKMKKEELAKNQENIEFMQSKLDEFSELVDSLRKDILELTSKQKEDAFTMGNQSNQIIQLDKVVQSETERNTFLVEQITQLNTINDSLQRETKSQKVVILSIQDQYALDISNLQKLKKKELDRFTGLEYKVHLMELEDMRSRNFELGSKILSLTQTLQKRTEETKVHLNSIKSKDVSISQLKQCTLALKKHIIHLVKRQFNGDSQHQVMIQKHTTQISGLEKQITSLKDEIQVKEHRELETEEILASNSQEIIALAKNLTQLNEELAYKQLIIEELSQQIEKFESTDQQQQQYQPNSLHHSQQTINHSMSIDMTAKQIPSNINDKNHEDSNPIQFYESADQNRNEPNQLENNPGTPKVRLPSLHTTQSGRRKLDSARVTLEAAAAATSTLENRARLNAEQDQPFSIADGKSKKRTIEESIDRASQNFSLRQETPKAKSRVNSVLGDYHTQMSTYRNMNSLNATELDNITHNSNSIRDPQRNRRSRTEQDSYRDELTNAAAGVSASTHSPNLKLNSAQFPQQQQRVHSVLPVIKDFHIVHERAKFRKEEQSNFYRGGAAYKITVDHSAQIQQQILKQLQKPKKEQNNQGRVKNVNQNLEK